MIKHVVMFKLKNPDDAPIVKEHLMELKNVVDVMRLWEVGINIGPSSKPYEVVIYSEFENMEDLAIFRKHPKHAEVKNAIAEYIEASGTNDYDNQVS